MAITQRLKHAWDAFRNRDPTSVDVYSLGEANHRNPDKVRLTVTNERSIIASIYNRVAIDVASIDFRHVRLDQNGRYIEEIDDSLNQCLKTSPNIDQTPRSFIEDVVLSLFDEGYIAIFPAEADYDIIKTGSYEIYQLRRGRIVEWYPEHVRLEAYNQNTGRLQEIIMPKDKVAIIENPLYTVMNGQNSTLKRLTHKLSLLDSVDQQSTSGKLDLIIQLPYVVKTDTKKQLALQRKKDIEEQLANSKYGIAYVDSTERITQLNRPIENNLLGQVEYLQKDLYSQLGMTTGVMDGTASETEMLNYNNRTIEPIAGAIASELNRKFLTKTARSQGQSIKYFRDPFKLVPVSQIAEIGDKFTRNEILTPNEIRSIMGFRPAQDPRADELRNANIAASKQDQPGSRGPAVPQTEGGIQNE